MVSLQTDAASVALVVGYFWWWWWWCTWDSWGTFLCWTQLIVFDGLVPVDQWLSVQKNCRRIKHLATIGQVPLQLFGLRDVTWTDTG